MSVSSSASIYENFFVSSYPNTSLPPLWQVIYQEAVRGHHLLFKRSDVALFDNEVVSLDNPDELSEELEGVVMEIMNKPDLNGMIAIIDALPIAVRHKLYSLYRRTLWLWTNYIRNQMN